MRLAAVRSPSSALCPAVDASMAPGAVLLRVRTEASRLRLSGGLYWHRKSSGSAFGPSWALPWVRSKLSPRLLRVAHLRDSSGSASRYCARTLVGHGAAGHGGSRSLLVRAFQHRRPSWSGSPTGTPTVLLLTDYSLTILLHPSPHIPPPPPYLLTFHPRPYLHLAFLFYLSSPPTSLSSPPRA
jgi:hypothetical protein